MPLKPGSSRDVISDNIRNEMASGRKQDQAVAIALKMARKSYAEGGEVSDKIPFDTAVTARDPSWREQIADWIMGQNASPERRRFATNLTGSQDASFPLVNYTPVAPAVDAVDNATQGNYRKAALNAAETASSFVPYSYIAGKLGKLISRPAEEAVAKLPNPMARADALEAQMLDNMTKAKQLRKDIDELLAINNKTTELNKRSVELANRPFMGSSIDNEAIQSYPLMLQHFLRARSYAPKESQRVPLSTWHNTRNRVANDFNRGGAVGAALNLARKSYALGGATDMVDAPMIPPPNSPPADYSMINPPQPDQPMSPPPQAQMGGMSPPPPAPMPMPMAPPPAPAPQPEATPLQLVSKAMDLLAKNTEKVLGALVPKPQQPKPSLPAVAAFADGGGVGEGGMGLMGMIPMGGLIDILKNGGGMGLIDIMKDKNAGLGLMQLMNKNRDGEKKDPLEDAKVPLTYAKGGDVRPPWYQISESRNLMRQGALHSPVPGRTDAIPVTAKKGAYVVPADVVSGLGQGNTMAGTKTLEAMFKTGPYGTTMPKMRRPALPTGNRRNRGFAEGGGIEEPGVDIMAAGGEFIVPPEAVAEIGGGDIAHGHDILDAFVQKVRGDTIATMQQLPGPK